MRKFFKSLVKAIGYFAIYLGVQTTVSFVYSFFGVIPIVVKYIVMGADLQNSDVLDQYMGDITQFTLESTMPVTVISGILTVVVVWLMTLVEKESITETLSLRKLSLNIVPPIVLLGMGLNVLTGVFLSVLPEEWLGAYETSSSVLFESGFAVMVLATAVVAPVVEEIIFRGLAYTCMKKGMPSVVAMIFASALFGVAHGQPVWMLYTFVFGMVLVWVFERTKSLYACILLHFGYNVCAVFLSVLPEESPDVLGIVITGLAVVAAIGSTVWIFMIPKEELPEEVTVSEGILAENTEEPEENPENGF